MGFEPTIRCYTYNGLANRRLQPLGHPSTDEWVHGVCRRRLSTARRRRQWSIGRTATPARAAPGRGAEASAMAVAVRLGHAHQLQCVAEIDEVALAFGQAEPVEGGDRVADE